MKEKVIIRKCDSYEDVSKIEGIIREGMEALNIKPHGKVLMKPNVVFAHRRYATHTYTDRAVLEAMFRILQNRPEIKSLTLGERCAVTIPTRYLFHENGYTKLAKKYGVKCVYFDEDRKKKVYLKHGTVHHALKFPATVVDADYKIYLPKLKNHASTKLTCALKLNIGICDSPQRLLHHDYLLEEKIADLYEVGKPDFIVVDGIVGGQKNELVPEPLFIGAIVMGTNSIAVDAICARIISLEPEDIKHLMIAHGRGFGPVRLEDIDLDTDISLDVLRERTKNLDRSYNDLRTMGLPVQLHLGNYPNGDDLCHTGCTNMLKTVFAIMEAYHPGNIANLRPFHIVIGEYKGDVISKDEVVILVGDCTKVFGKLEGKKIVRIKGCPVPVPYFMIYACHYGKVKSPYFDPLAMYGLPYYAVASQLSKMARKWGLKD